MKNSELIKLLQSFPADMEVIIYDWEKNARDDDGDGSSVGLYPDFEVEKIELEPDEVQYYEETYGKKFVPFVALGFKNEEYDDDTRTCRVCGCTEQDCSQCVEKTGVPCHWVEDDLCSACMKSEKTEM